MTTNRLNNQQIELTADQRLMVAKMMENARDVKCECGNEFFVQGVRVKTISKLITNGDEDSVIPSPNLFCPKCFKELVF